jgi:hypothetical protein
MDLKEIIFQVLLKKADMQQEDLKEMKKVRK